MTAGLLNLRTPPMPYRLIKLAEAHAESGKYNIRYADGRHGGATRQASLCLCVSVVFSLWQPDSHREPFGTKGLACRRVGLGRATSGRTQPNPLSPCRIGGLELDTGPFQGGLDRKNGAESGIDLFGLQAAKGIHRDDGAVGKVLLGPAEQGPGGPDLACGNHAGMSASPRHPPKQTWCFSFVKECISPFAIHNYAA